MKTQRCCVRGVARCFPNAQARLWCQDSGITLRFYWRYVRPNRDNFLLLAVRVCARDRCRRSSRCCINWGVNTSSARVTIVRLKPRTEGGQIMDPGKSSRFSSAFTDRCRWWKRAVTPQTGKLVSQLCG